MSVTQHLALILAAALVGPAAALAAAHEDLQKTVAQVEKAYDEINAKALCDLQHAKVVNFGPDSVVPLQGKEPVCQALTDFFGSLERSNLTLVNTQYHVEGDTGLAWGHYVYQRKQKDGPLGAESGRWMGTFVRSGEKWLQIGIHITRLGVAVSD